MYNNTDVPRLIIRHIRNKIDKPTANFASQSNDSFHTLVTETSNPRIVFIEKSVTIHTQRMHP